MKVVTNFSIYPQYTYKQAFISFFVTHGPQMLTISVLMVLSESSGNFCEPRYLKLIDLSFVMVPDELKIVYLENFVIRAKVVGSRDPISYS